MYFFCNTPKFASLVTKVWWHPTWLKIIRHIYCLYFQSAFARFEIFYVNWECVQFLTSMQGYSTSGFLWKLYLVSSIWSVFVDEGSMFVLSSIYVNVKDYAAFQKLRFPVLISVPKMSYNDLQYLPTGFIYFLFM